MYDVLCFSKSFFAIDDIWLLNVQTSICLKQIRLIFFLCSEDFPYNVCRASPKYIKLHFGTPIHQSKRYLFIQILHNGSFVTISVHSQNVMSTHSHATKRQMNSNQICEICVVLVLVLVRGVEESLVENLGGERMIMITDPHCCSHYGLNPMSLLWKQNM